MGYNSGMDSVSYVGPLGSGVEIFFDNASYSFPPGEQVAVPQKLRSILSKRADFDAVISEKVVPEKVSAEGSK